MVGITSQRGSSIDQWRIREHLGCNWPSELVWRSLASRPNAAELEVVDEAGKASPAQLHPTEPRVAYITNLPAGASKTFTLRTAAEPAKPYLQLVTSPGLAEIIGDRFAVRLEWEGADIAAAAPLRAIRGVDGVWFGGSSLSAGAPAATSIRCEVLAQGPVFIALRQTYTLANGSTLRLTWEIDGATPAVRYMQDQDGQAGGAIVWHLGRGFKPTQAYWRCHTSPRQPAHSDRSYHRQRFAVRWPAEPELTELGLLYTHGVNRSNIWAGWCEQGRRDLLMVAPIRPSRTGIPAGYEWARHTVVEANGRQSIDLELPLQEGVRPFALGLLDREAADLSCEPGPNPANDIDRFCARLMALGLNDYADMRFDWPGIEAMRFPQIWLQPDEVADVRKSFNEWTWLKDQFHTHVEDRFFNSRDSVAMLLEHGLPPVGGDMAGAYLATGDESYAARAKDELIARLDEQVERMCGYSIGNERNFGLALGWFIPCIVLALDSILSSEQFSEGERLATFRKLVFLAEVLNNEDIWPAADRGLAMGNPNFNSCVIFARAILAAMMTGHPKQTRWFADIRRQLELLIEREADDEGSFRESLTYQIAEIGYVLQSALAMGPEEAKPILQQPRLKAAITFWMDTLTPPDTRCRGARIYPPLGHAQSGGYCQSGSVYLALAARLYRDLDPDLSKRCMSAWRACGAWVCNWLHMLFHGSLVWAQPLCFVDRHLPDDGVEPVRHDSRTCGQTGAMLRHRHDGGNAAEGYLLFKTGQARGHFDSDEGSFIWYAYGTPLLIDYETQYSPLIEQPWLNNRISVDHKMDPGRAGRFLAQQFTPEVDYLCSEQVITAIRELPEWPQRSRFSQRGWDYHSSPWRQIPAHRWRRHLLYIKPFETLVLLDDINGTLPTDWSIQVLADHVRTTDTTSRFKGQLGVDLVVAFAQPSNPDLVVSAFAHVGDDEPDKHHELMRSWCWTRPDIDEKDVFANRGGEHTVILRAHAAPARAYLAMLAAYPADGPAPQIAVKPGGWGFVLQTPAGQADVSVREDTRHWDVSVRTANGELHRQFRIGSNGEGGPHSANG